MKPSNGISSQAKHESLCAENLCCPTFPSSRDSCFMALYGLRYYFIRLLASPASTVPSSIPLVGGKSVFEISVVAFAYALLIGVAAGTIEDVGSKGVLASIVGTFTVLLALRNNILTLFFSISFERALSFHKMFAVLTIALVVVHAAGAYLAAAQAGEAIDQGQVVTGFMLLGTMAFMGLTYLAKKIGKFEVFYYLHIASYLFIVLLAAIHGAIILAISVLFWAFDLFLRYVLTVHREQAIIEVLPADVTRIRFPKSFAYSSGQYCFISIPSLSYLQFHPFTISSAPHEDEIHFHVRILGDWTTSLKQLIDEKGTSAAAVKDEEGLSLSQIYAGPHDNTTLKKTLQIDVVVEGPFGIPSIDLLTDQYSVYLFITGGIGVTPAQSMWNHLVHLQKNGQRPSLRKSVFVWSVRDKALMDGIFDHADLTTTLTLTSAIKTHSLLASAQPPPLSSPAGQEGELPHRDAGSLHQPGDVVDLEQQQQQQQQEQQEPQPIRTTGTTPTGGGFSGRGVVKQGEECVSPLWWEQNEGHRGADGELPATHTDNHRGAHTTASSSSSSHNKQISSSDPFHAEFYLTSLRNQEEFRKAGIDSQKQPYLRFGRPDVPDLFTRVEGMCSAEGIGRVAVVCCGPSSLMESVQAECRKRGRWCLSTSSSSSNVSFDLHLEVFDF